MYSARGQRRKMGRGKECLEDISAWFHCWRSPEIKLPGMKLWWSERHWAGLEWCWAVVFKACFLWAPQCYFKRKQAFLGPLVSLYRSFNDADTNNQLETNHLYVLNALLFQKPVFHENCKSFPKSYQTQDTGHWGEGEKNNFLVTLEFKFKFKSIAFSKPQQP